jgi:hypothetical protein
MADLHTEINKLIEMRLRKNLDSGQSIDVLEWISQFAESFADLVVFSSLDEERPKLIQHALERIQFFIREKEKMFGKVERLERWSHHGG